MALADKNPLWRPPAHHLDMDKSHDHVHWMELFYDLVHVVMVFLLGNYLSEQMHHGHGVAGFIAFFLLFSAMWLAWGETSIYNSLYVSTDWVYRLSTAFQTLSVMFMAASISSISPSITDPGKGFSYFAAAYGMNRLILASMYYRVKHHGIESTSLSAEQAVRFFGLGLWFMASAAAPNSVGVWMFITGVVATQAFYMFPSLTIMRLPRFVPRMGHITERFALLLLIVNGEGFFKLCVTLSEKGIYKVHWQTLVNLSIGGLAIFALTWVYFDFVANGTPKQDRKSGYTVWLAHLTLMASAIMMGVSMAGEVYVGFFEPFPTGYGILGCTGLAIYFLSIYAIQKSIEPTAAHRFATPKILLTGVVLALICLVSFPYFPAIVGNAVWASGLFVVLMIPIRRAYKTLSVEEAD
ncbi:MAG: low temperature requirement protein A [Gammaproteobacteria bacterium]|nr:low temperature requirement protein A [Gammaproteobacteria bacterium]